MGIVLLRRMGRRLWDCVIFVLAALLVLQVFFWWCVHNDRQFPVPEFVTRWVREGMAQAGVAFQFEAVRFRPSGYLEFEGVSLGALGGGAPGFTAQRVAATVSFPHLARGEVVLRRVLLDGGAFHCPATVARDGRRHVVLGEVRAMLEQERGRVRVETFQGRLGEVPLVVHGEFLPHGVFAENFALPPRRLWGGGGGMRTLGPEEWGAVNRVAVALLDVRGQLEAAGWRGGAEVVVGKDAAGDVVLSVGARGEKLEFADGCGWLREVLVAGEARFDGARFVPAGEWAIEAAGGGEWVDAERGVAARVGAVRVSGRPGEGWALPAGVRAVASDWVVNGCAGDFVRGDVHWGDFPSLAVAGVVVCGGDVVEVHGNGDWDARAGAVEVVARVESLGRYLALPKVAGRLPAEVASALTLGGALRADGRVAFARGGVFEEACFRLGTGAVRFGEIELSGAEGWVRMTPSGLEVRDARLQGTGWGVEGDFSTGFAHDGDYRFLLRGSTEPRLLNGFLGGWWARLWADFGLRREALPRADIEVRGRWSGRPDEFIYCAVVADGVRFRGVDFAGAQVRIAELPRVLAVFDLRAWRADGTGADGALQWHYSPLPEHRRESLRFRFSGALPKDVAVVVAGEGLPESLTGVRVDGAVDAEVTGFYHGVASGSPGREQVVVRVRTPGVVEAWGMPFANFAGEVAYDSRRVAVTVFEAGFADGKVASRPEVGRWQRAWVDLRPPEPVLSLDVEVEGARRSKFFDSLGALRRERDVAPPEPRKDASRMDVRFCGGIVLPRLETLDGAGRVRLHEPELMQLHVFGGLSRLMNSLGVGLTSFELDRVEGDFTICDGKVYFPGLKLTGNGAQVDCVGRYGLVDDGLHFRAKLTAKKGNGIPLLGDVLELVNRLPRLAPVNIRGTLQKPSWSIDPTPSAFWKNALDPGEGSPPPRTGQSLSVP
ncbi:MAG: AsmA-like C-terminal region-containing protein [Puniceicoccales bacterium]|jgi:hypothetical protein|nr:AsmA-like C-terminal region-containing protein [Puniceicoccales bacterium]